MLGLNPLILGIGVSMYIVPIFAVSTAVTACCCIIIRHNKLEREYIYKHKLVADELKEIDYEDLIKTEYELTLENKSLETDNLIGDIDLLDV